jgi:hypothetical protein
MRPDARYIEAGFREFIGKVCWNPNYPSVPPVSHLGCVPLPRGKAKDKFRKALVASVRVEGFRNPITGYSVKEGIIIQYGASRLRTARQLGIKIPVIVLDYGERHKSAPLVTNENYAEFFTDVPRAFEIRPPDEEHPGGWYIHHSYFIAKRDRESKYTYDPAGVAWLGNDPTGVIDDELRFVRADIEEQKDAKKPRKTTG